MNVERPSETPSKLALGSDRRERKSKRHAEDQKSKAGRDARKRLKTGTERSRQSAGTADEEDRPDQTTSFRHLFSFAKGGGAEKPEEASNSFSLFGESQEETTSGNFRPFGEEKRASGEHNAYNSHHGMPKRRPAPESGRTDEGMAWNMSGIQVTKTSRSALSNEQAGRSAFGVKSKSAPCSSVSVDDIDTSPGAILEIANRFCRSKDMGQLEREWCEENGTRDQMKRDFKAKRSRSLKDRNLRGSFRL